MFLLVFRLISKEPYIDKTRIGVYGKVRRTSAGFTVLLDGASVGRVGHPIIFRLALLMSVSLSPKCFPVGLEAHCTAAAAFSVHVNGFIRGFVKLFVSCEGSV